MDLKPSQDKQAKRPKLDGMGREVRPGDERNPFASLARGTNQQGAKRRRWASDTLGATPPRDGPFSPGAADVAATKPPKARQRREMNPGLPFPVKR